MVASTDILVSVGMLPFFTGWSLWRDSLLEESDLSSSVSICVLASNLKAIWPRWC